MKKLASTLAIFCIFAGVFAQKNLTPAQQSFQTSIVNFLREEGYSPSINDNNRVIVFKSEGKNHYISIYKESPFFVTIEVSGFTLQGEDAFERTASLLACNDLNKNIEVVKLYCGSNEEGVNVQVEQYFRSIQDFKYVFAKNLSALTSAKKQFYEKYTANGGQ
ncbi:MAG: hypothetical protein LBL94_10395 [Prevotellaceae bacterium]|jgi:hypothetical protein|nr:hypothetical protein [Prevotellaceae bacterium]